MDLQAMIAALYPQGAPKRPTGQQVDILRHQTGPAWVLAGPGSGKTEVLSLLVLRLLYVDKDPIQPAPIPPESIFVTTFTEKAAKNLQDRISRYRDKLVQVDPSLADVDLAKLRIGTLHGLANDVLQEYRASNYRNVRLMDELETAMFVHENMSIIRSSDDAIDRPFWAHFAFLINPYDWKPSYKLLPTEWVRTRTLITLFNRICEDRKSLTAMRKAGGPIERLADLYEEYQNHLASEHRCDFSQLQLRFLEFLQSPDGQRFRDGIQGDDDQPGITHVLVDEYQDTNLVQEAIYFELSQRVPHNLIVVGDDDQAMYRFRGGSVECMVSFDEACKTFLGISTGSVKKYPLVGNFRSHPDIVEFCNDYLTAFSSMSTPGARVPGKPRMTALGSISGKYNAVGIVSRGTLSLVAAEFADSVWDLKNSGVVADYSQIALLLHSTKESKQNAGPYVEALRTKGIPVYNPRNRTFLEQPEVAGLLGCLMLLLDPHTAHIPNWAPRELPGVIQAFQTESAGLVAKHPELAKYVQNVQKNLSSKPGTYLDATLQELVYYLLSLPPFDSYMAAVESRQRLARLTALLESYASIPVQGQQYVSRGNLQSNADGSGSVHPGWLKTFYRRFFGYLANGGVNDTEDESVISPAGMVSVMTMHQSKGLEFPFVFVGHLGDDAGPESTHELEDMFGAFPNLSGRSFKALSAGVRAELDTVRKYYVAYSRAEHALVLLGTKNQVAKGATPCGPTKDWLRTKVYEL